MMLSEQGQTLIKNFHMTRVHSARYMTEEFPSNTAGNDVDDWWRKHQLIYTAVVSTDSLELLEDVAKLPLK